MRSAPTATSFPLVPKIVPLAEAVAGLVRDGDTVALEGFTHLIPFAAAHEIIRQGRRDLTLVRMTPDVIYDQLIGAGCAAKLVFSWGGNPAVGSLHRLRVGGEAAWPARAVRCERACPGPLLLHQFSHGAMAAAYDAGAANIPFATIRTHACSLTEVNPHYRTVVCPFTGETLTAVPALRPDATIIHAQKADKEGNVLISGIIGVQKEAALAARRVVVTVEEIVDSFEGSGP